MPMAVQSPPNRRQNEALASPTVSSTKIGSMRGLSISSPKRRRTSARGSPSSRASQLRALRSELRSKLTGSAGIRTTRVTASPLASSRTVRIVLRWKLESWTSTPCEAPMRCELRITREVCTPDPSR